MPSPAEDGTVSDKITDLVGRETRFSGSALGDLHIQPEFTNPNAMRDIVALQHQHHRLALLQSDHARIEGKSFCGNLHTARVYRRNT